MPKESMGLEILLLIFLGELKRKIEVDGYEIIESDKIDNRIAYTMFIF